MGLCADSKKCPLHGAVLGVECIYETKLGAKTVLSVCRDSEVNMKEQNSKINNVSKKYDDEATRNLRSAIEHRATWFYLLLDAAKNNHADAEKTGREAVHRCGVFMAENNILPNCANAADLTDFFGPFMPEATQKALEVEVVCKTPEKLTMEFHYCPLVNAWKKLGCSDEEIALLCDMAMDGDRGIAEACAFDISIEHKIADGDPFCQIEFRT
jgi:hypothetical protein